MDPWAAGWARATEERNHLRTKVSWKPKDRFEQMGGERGCSIIMGGFPRWTKRKGLEEAFEEVKAKLPGELRHRIEKPVFPGTRGHLINIDLVSERHIA